MFFHIFLHDDPFELSWQCKDLKTDLKKKDIHQKYIHSHKNVYTQKPDAVHHVR